MIGKFLTRKDKAQTTKWIPKLNIKSPSLESIPETRQRAFSVSRLPEKNSDPELIQKLLSRNHSVFKSYDGSSTVRKESSTATTLGNNR
jgi:hypothetical protein